MRPKNKSLPELGGLLGGAMVADDEQSGSETENRVSAPSPSPGYARDFPPHFVKKNLFYFVGGATAPPQGATPPIGSGFAGGASAPRCLLVPHFVALPIGSDFVPKSQSLTILLLYFFESQ